MWQPARSLIWSTTWWPGSLLFSDFQTFTVSLSQLISAFAWGACVPWILQFSNNSLAQDKTGACNQDLGCRVSPIAVPLGAGAEVPSLLRGQPEGKSSGVSSFFFNRDGPWQIILVVLRQLFGVVRTLYGEKCSSCSTVNSGTLTGTLYVIQVEKPYLCHEGCSPSFLTWGFLLSADSFAHPIICRFPRVDPDWHLHLQISSLPGLWCCAQEREVLGGG